MSKMMDRGSRFLARGREEGKELLKDDLLRNRGGWFLGIKGGISSVRSQATSSVGRVETLARAAFSTETVEDAPLSDASPSVRFDEAQEFYGRNDAYVRAVQDNKYKAVLLYLAMVFAILAIDIATWRSYVSSTIMVIGHLSPTIPALALAIQAAFGNWQVRRRSLDGFRSFLGKPGEWWPEPSADMQSSQLLRGPAAMILVGAGIASAAIIGTAPSAMAQTTTAATGSSTLLTAFTTLPTTDLWGKLLGFVFPGIGPLTGVGVESPISDGITSAFAAMISCLMALGALFLSWFTVVGTVATATEGKVLGQRWHLTWAPIRVCYGFASLVPVVKGYCLLQIMLLWLAVASGHLGNVIWNGFVTGLTSPTMSTPSLPQSMNYVREQLRTEVCFAESEAIAASYGTPLPTWPDTGVAGHTVGTISKSVWDDIIAGISGNGPYTDPDTLKNYSWDYGDCGQVTGDFTDSTSALGTLNSAQISAMKTLRTALRTDAQAIVATTQSGSAGTDQTSLSMVYANVMQAKSAFDASLTSANTAYVESSAGDGASIDAFKTSAESTGWVSAGTYYMTIARINSALMNATSNLPKVDNESLNPNTVSGPLLDHLYGAAAPLENDPNAVMIRFDAWWQKNLNTDNGLDPSAAAAGTMTSASLWGGMKSMSSPDSGVQSLLLGAVTPSPGNFNGMQQMVSLGDYIIGIGETIVGGAVIAKIGLGFTAVGKAAAVAGKMAGGGSAGAMSGPLSFATLFLGMVGVSILSAGAFDSLVLPMIPFIHFTFAIMGILILVVEAVVAGPLWAFSHIRLDGQGFEDGPQKAGYQIVFNLIWRIPLTIFGLLFSFLVFDAMIWLESVTLLPAMTTATADSLFGIIGTLVYIVMTTAITWSIANRSFSLITALPDRVTRWFGANGDGTSQESHEAGAALAVVRQGAKEGISGLAQKGQGAKIMQNGKAGGQAAQNQAQRAIQAGERKPAQAGTDNGGGSAGDASTAGGRINDTRQPQREEGGTTNEA